MSFMLGHRSRGELHGVHDDLVFLAERAITITPVDFSVHDGLRSVAEQRNYVASGVSKTMRSYHLPQHPEGRGWAVDLVPYINRKLRWEWKPLYRIATAMHEVANEYEIELRWGAVWDRVFNNLDASDIESEVRLYVDRRRSVGKSAFLDGPHYELYREGHHQWGRLS